MFFQVSLTITRDNQGKDPNDSNIDRDNQTSFILIITDTNHLFHHFSPNLSKSVRDSQDHTDDRIKI
jgi:hypothetical protein